MMRALPSSAGGRAGRNRAGFTLLEVLLAVALSGMLLVAVNFFVLGLGELWGRGAEPRLFDRHVRGVTRFLEALMDQAVVPTQDDSRPASDAPPVTRLPRRSRPVAVATERGSAEGLAGALGRAVLGAMIERVPAGRLLVGGAAGLLRAQVPPDRGGRGRLPAPVRDADPARPPQIGTHPSGGDRSGAQAEEMSLATGARFRFGTPAGYEGTAPMLMFEVDEAPGQCVWPQAPLPQVECALQINADEGLVLLWKSKLEEDYGKARPRKTQVSPFGRAIAYDYYDAEQKVWSHSDQPQRDGKGGWLVPQRVRLTFAYRGLEREVSIVLPEPPGGAPLR